MVAVPLFAFVSRGAFLFALGVVAWLAEPLHVLDAVDAAGGEADDVVLDETYAGCAALVAAFGWVFASVSVTDCGGTLGLTPTHEPTGM